MKTLSLRPRRVRRRRARSGAELPGIPTMTEAGLEGFEAVTGYGLLAPKKPQAEIIAKCNASLRNAIVDRDIGGRLWLLRALLGRLRLPTKDGGIAFACRHDAVWHFETRC